MTGVALATTESGHFSMCEQWKLNFCLLILMYTIISPSLLFGERRQRFQEADCITVTGPAVREQVK